MAEITFIDGTSRNDVLQPYRGDAYQAGKLVLLVSGSPAAGAMPLINVLVNGQVVLANVRIDAVYAAGQTQLVTWSLPYGLAIDSVAIQYTNDLYSATEDRNVFVTGVTLNGFVLPIASATYLPDYEPPQIGSQLVAWDGRLVFSGPAVGSAAVADTLARSVIIDGLAGTDIALYHGRASGYDVALGTSGIRVSGKTGASGPDFLNNVERVLFDDFDLYGGGKAALGQDGTLRTTDGGTGIDTLAFNASLWGYTINRTSGAAFTVTHSGQEGAEVVVNVERLVFSDARVALDVDGNGGKAYRLYQAAFNRAPDLPGLGFQMTALDNATGIAQVAQNFMDSPEFRFTYGYLDTWQFVNQLYLNVLHRGPDQGGLDFHTGNLNSGALSRADVLVQFSESPENQAALIGTIGNGMPYTL